jgi:hypothetical protein
MTAELGSDAAQPAKLRGQRLGRVTYLYFSFSKGDGKFLHQRGIGIVDVARQPPTTSFACPREDKIPPCVRNRLNR